MKRFNFKKAKWIWKKGTEKKDSYVRFSDTFSANENDKVKIYISADSVYNLYVNGEIVAFSLCADYPYYKMVDNIDISKNIVQGENKIDIDVWYYGEDSQTYKKAKEGLIFEVTVEKEVVLFSNKKTKSRIMNEYKNGYGKVITSQLGFSFLFDNTVKKSEYSDSYENGKKTKNYLRKILPLKLFDREKVKTKKIDGGYIIDLGKETAGFFDFDVTSEEKQKIKISYAEHLTEGDVVSIIGARDFSFEFIAKKGENSYINTFRRIACRYLKIESKEEFKINYAGVRPVFYPVNEKKAEIEDKKLKEIYDVSVNTLKLCMHEHYEDCPWREQALYVLDSRNQMLCGYYAFNNNDYAKHNILLMSKGIRKDGAMALSFPAGIDYPIPFFSLAYIIEVYEYIKNTGDLGILNTVGKTVKKIMKTFSKRVKRNGLIPAFPYPFWNFYEWADSSHNENEILRKKSDKYVLHYDLILNCMYAYCVNFYNKLFNKNLSNEKTVQAIKDTFYVKEKGAFKLADNLEKFSELGQAMAILCGAGDENSVSVMIKDKSLIPATLSMRTFVYDSLLTFGDKYYGFIEKDILSRYGKMLREGATSFWETELGYKDFDNAGSLCHGWSAIPVYYLNVLNKVRY